MRAIDRSAVLSTASPAKAGVQRRASRVFVQEDWIPAFAGNADLKVRFRDDEPLRLASGVEEFLQRAEDAFEFQAGVGYGERVDGASARGDGLVAN